MKVQPKHECYGNPDKEIRIISQESSTDHRFFSPKTPEQELTLMILMKDYSEVK